MFSLYASVAMHTDSISLKNIQCQRNGEALFSPVECRLACGELIALSGPNGIGKTTLLESLAGLRHLPEQQLSWPGSVFDQRLYCGHKLAISGGLSCLENLRFLAAVHQHDRREDTLLELLDTVALSGYEHTLADELSAGQKKKLSLLRLNLSQACLWLLDEPFSNLDQSGHDWLLQRILQQRDAGGCIIASIHQQPQLMAQATQHMVLQPV